jgi:hypothetical protein
MRAEDILEVFVLLHGHGRVPVTVQRAIEREDRGAAIDLAQRWVGSECAREADCNFAGGRCRQNPYGHSFCTTACSGACADRPGEIATACAPGPEGFVGDPCLSSADCAAGRTCERRGPGPGLCTQPCDATRACPTQNGIRTTCVAGRCVKACDVQDACGAAVATTCTKAAMACLPSGG